MNLKEVVDVIQQEIDWCVKNMPPKNEEDYNFSKGFCDGLKQAKLLITSSEHLSTKD